MILKTSTFALIIVACCMMVTPSEAQLVRQLGRLPFVGKVKQASFFGGGCDSCAAGPSCGLDGCADPACGCAAPSCGLAGSILGGCFGGGPGGCGAAMEPACGSAGLGYGGGFGLCGGSCDSCGTGGYLGRNLQYVNPCACGGSLIADMARGFFSLVDRAVGATVTTFFGGLQQVTCHASGTFAALQCAAAASCSSCGTVGCDGSGCCGAGAACGLPGPGCGCVDATCGAPLCGAPTVLATPPNYAPTYAPAPSYASPSYAPAASSVGSGYSQPFEPTPAPVMDAVPIPQASPAVVDPFLDDVVPVPQARRARPRQADAVGYRVYDSPPAPPRTQVAGRIPSGGVQPQRGVRTATHTSASQTRSVLHHRYLQAKGRPATLRR